MSRGKWEGTLCLSYNNNTQSPQNISSTADDQRVTVAKRESEAQILHHDTATVLSLILLTELLTQPPGKPTLDTQTQIKKATIKGWIANSNKKKWLESVQVAFLDFLEWLWLAGGCGVVLYCVALVTQGSAQSEVDGEILQGEKRAINPTSNLKKK